MLEVDIQKFGGRGAGSGAGTRTIYSSDKEHKWTINKLKGEKDSYSVQFYEKTENLGWHKIGNAERYSKSGLEEDFGIMTSKTTSSRSKLLQEQRRIQDKMTNAANKGDWREYNKFTRRYEKINKELRGY